MHDGCLTRRLQVTYSGIFALGFVCAALLIGIAVYAVQLKALYRDVHNGLVVYSQRAMIEGPVRTRAQVARLVAGTSHPGWTLIVATSERDRYIVRWRPDTITLESRLHRYSDLQPFVAPERSIAGVTEIEIYPFGAVEAIAARTFIPVAIVAVLLVMLAYRIGARRAREAVQPLRDLQEVYQRAEAGDFRPHYLPESGPDELRTLIAAYNRAIAERDATEQRVHQFMTDVNHQLRTPLTVLGGFIGIMRKGQLRDPGDGPKFLEKMEQQIHIMRNLVERLMLLQRWDSDDRPSCEQADIGELVSAVVDPMAASNPGVNIRLDVVTGAIACVDREEICQAVTNLVANAVKYAPDAAITAGVHTDDGSVYISVADEGPGIPADALSHIFDRFYRANRDRPGSGLGLAIAKGAVERSHGTIAVESTLGKGARFTITLPRLRVSPREHVML
jgi:two-component system, OmpR family, sensor kinase